jgi:two-component system cell cycle sensor histidine kinase/response regulator CckA
VSANRGWRVGTARIAGRGRESTIDLVLTDVVMPHVSGRELVARFTPLRPGIKALFMSGHADTVVVHEGVLEAGVQFIQKPFSPEQLAGKIRAVLGAP